MERTLPQFIGIDAGNSAIKWAIFDEHGRIHYGIILNVAGPAISLDFAPSGPDEDTLKVSVNNSEPLFLGSLALNQLQDSANQDRSRDKVNSDNINLFVPAILGLLTDKRPQVIAVGATLTDYADQAPRIQQKLTGRQSVFYYYGSHRGLQQPEVIKAYTYAQAASGLLGMLRADDGTIIRTDWLDKTILALDFGHGQINIAVMQKLQFIKAACFSLDYGFYRVVGAVQDTLNRSPYYVTASIPQLQEATERGLYLRNGNPIDLMPVIEGACGDLADMVCREVRGKITGALFDSVTQIIVMGGGGPRMAPFIGSLFGIPVEVAPNSLYANAKGLLLVAKEKWGKEGV